MESDSSTSYSPSKLDCYRECPRRYRYRYVDRIRTETQSVEAFLGSCVHAALEELYRGLARGRAASLRSVLARFELAWKEGWSDKIVVRDPAAEPEDFRRVGREAVDGYYRAHSPFDRDKTVDVERKVSFPLKAGSESYRIEGYVDRLALAPDGAFEIHDYKTSRSLPAQESLERDWQLPLYEIAVRHLWPDTRQVRLVWHYVRFGKELRVVKAPEALERLKAEVAGTILAIKADHDFVPRRSALCDWCEYREICPLWSHPERVARMEPQTRRQDDGVRLVGRLASLELKKRELREELRRLEREGAGLDEELIRFAESQGVSVVGGLEGEAEVVEKEEVKFPTRTQSPEEYEALERELKGSPVWTEVSKLDARLLAEGYQAGKWIQAEPEGISAIIARYARMHRVKSVRFRRRKDLE